MYLLVRVLKIIINKLCIEGGYIGNELLFRRCLSACDLYQFLFNFVELAYKLFFNVSTTCIFKVCGVAVKREVKEILSKMVKIAETIA